MRELIAVVGDAEIEPNGLKEKMAFEMGKAIIDNGYRLQTGGLQGIMRAASMGARASKNYREGDIIGILPSFNHNQANEFVDIAIPTGIDVLRNALVANAKAVIGIGGGAGTLSELAMAWSLKRMVLAFNNVDGWSSKVADTRLDARIRYDDVKDDRVYGVSSAEQAIALINERLKLYDEYNEGLKV